MLAVRVAARIERELHVDVEKVKGHYGEYKLLVGGEIIIDGGAEALLGILQSGKKVVDAVKTRPIYAAWGIELTQGKTCHA
jgi:hypothetical protein